MAYVVTNDPDDTDFVTLDWATWLDGDALEASSWEQSPEGALETPRGADGTRDETSTTLWYRGGADGADVRLTNTVRTAAGRETQRVVVVRVRAR